MVRAAAWGLGAGAVVGLVTGVVLGLVAISSDEPGELGFVVVLLGAAGLVIGAVVGALVAVVGVLTARSAAGDAEARRRKGALAAAAVAAVLCVVSQPITPLLLAGVAAAAVVGGGLTWLALPRLVDLAAARPQVVDPAVPGQYGADPVAPSTPARPGLSTPLRVVVVVAAAGIGGLLGTNVVMAVVGAVASLSRDAEEVVAFGVLAVLAVLVGALVWLRTGPDRA